jgi:hypothetical protein
MSKLTELGSRKEVLAAIDSGGIKFFRDLPGQHKNADIALYWIKKCRAHSSEVEMQLSAIFLYRDVPFNCMTDDFLRIAAECGCPVICSIKPDQTTIYRDLVYLCIESSHSWIKYVYPAYGDEELLEYIFSRYSSNCWIWAYDNNWVMEVMSDDLFDRCCQARFLFALEAPAHRIKGDIGRFLDVSECNPEVIYRLRHKRRLDLITAKISTVDDLWPLLDAYRVITPRSVSDMLERLENAEPGSIDETIYMSILLLERIEKVVEMMASSRLKRLLLEMYPFEALEPFVKSDIGLKGVMLEEAMGL